MSGIRLSRRAKATVKRVRDWWLDPVVRIQSATLEATQVALAMRYRQLAAGGATSPDLRDIGFAVYSDTDEDGILLYLFALLGTESRVVVDIGSSSPLVGNSANLILHHGWTGLLVDCDEETVAQSQKFYRRNARSRLYPPKAVSAFVTAENVDEILLRHGVSGEIDLLSIDIDGMDLWVWQAINAVRPRVVVIEFQDILGSDRSVSVPYSANFNARDHPANRTMNNYVGASLAAMVKVGKAKGYRLVGVSRMGFNAFFVLDGLAPDLLPEVPAKDCLRHPWNDYGVRCRYPEVAGMNWVEI